MPKVEERRITIIEHKNRMTATLKGYSRAEAITVLEYMKINIMVDIREGKDAIRNERKKKGKREKGRATKRIARGK